MSDSDESEPEYSDSQVVDEAYLEPPSYDEKRVRTSMSEAEREIPWYLDDDSSRVKIIGKAIGALLLVGMLIIGFSVFSGGGETFLPETDNETDDPLFTSPDISDIEATNGTSVVFFESSDGSVLNVSPAPAPDDSLVIEEEKRIRLAGVTVPVSDVDRVEPEEYGLEDTEANRECLAMVGSDAEELIEDDLGGGAEVVLFNHGETFGNDSYEGYERYYAIAGEQSVSLTLSENGYGVLPEWDFEERPAGVAATQVAQENGDGVFECGVSVDSDGNVEA